MQKCMDWDWERIACMGATALESWAHTGTETSPPTATLTQNLDKSRALTPPAPYAVAHSPCAVMPQGTLQVTVLGGCGEPRLNDPEARARSRLCGMRHGSHRDEGPFLPSAELLAVAVTRQPRSLDLLCALRARAPGTLCALVDARRSGRLMRLPLQEHATFAIAVTMAGHPPRSAKNFCTGRCRLSSHSRDRETRGIHTDHRRPCVCIRRRPLASCVASPSSNSGEAWTEHRL